MLTNTPNPADKPLTPKQEWFCKLYCQYGKHFGNATAAYVEAYSIDISLPGAYSVARRSASENLTKPHILKRINALLDDTGFNDVEADKQLLFVMQQHNDLGAKMKAIAEYNKLKKRTAERLEVYDMTETRKKIRGFLDEPDDDLAAGQPSEQPDAPSVEHPAAAAAETGSEVAQPTPDIS